MQTFLPYPEFTESARVLDSRRLGKQRVECMQILNALADTSKGWTRHPATLMWRGHEDALRDYANAMILEWVKRGYNNTMKLYTVYTDYEIPRWIGDRRFHDSHKSNLLRKAPFFYSQYNWNVPANLPYVWPV